MNYPILYTSSNCILLFNLSLFMMISINSFEVLANDPILLFDKKISLLLLLDL